MKKLLHKQPRLAMRPYFFLVNLLIAVVAFKTLTAKAEVYLTESDALEKVLPGTDTFEKVFGILSAEQKETVQQQLKVSKADNTFAYYAGKNKQKQIIGYAVITDEIGKFQPITFAVGITPDFSISMIEIIAYRESHGGEIRRDSFRDQFKGKVLDGIGFDRGIRNIAGATLSCRSTIVAAKRALAYVSAAQSGVQIRKDPVPAPAAEKGDKGAFIRNQILMGTSLEIQAWQRIPGVRLEAAIDSAFAEVRRIEKVVSLYDPTSELSRWQASADRDNFVVSDTLLRIAEMSERMRAATDLYFEPAVAGLVTFWRQKIRESYLPSEDQIMGLKMKMANSSWHTKVENRTIVSQVPLSFDAISKGFALNAVRKILEPHASYFTINFGGQILTVDHRVPSPGSDVILDHPNFRSSLVPSVNLLNQSLSVSADSGDSNYIAGQNISHIINPKTGMPVKPGRYVAVLADSAAVADALSTAVAAMSTVDAVNFVARQKKAKIMLVDSDGKIYGGLH